MLVADSGGSGMRSLARIIVAIAAPILFFAVVQAQSQDLLTAEQWREDLRYLSTQIVKAHPDAFHDISEQDFKSAVADLNVRIPALSDHQVEMEFVRLVAMLREGHSRISLPGLPDPMSDVADITPFKDQRLAFHRLPVRLFAFSDGLYIIGTTPDLHNLIGSKVLQIGGHPVQGLVEAVRPLVNRENDTAALLIAPEMLVVPEVLQAINVVTDPSRVPFTLQTSNGRNSQVNMSPLGPGEQARWVGVESITAPPEYQQHLDANLWARYEPKSKSVYIKINVLQDPKDKTVAMFAREVASLAESSSPERLIVDFRGCHGGDNQKFRSLLLELVRDERINQLGKLFIIFDRGTFSAGVNAVSDLERLSNSILIGEPTAGAPGSWGDPAKITLPNSGLIARISTLYWSDWTPSRARPAITPDISIPLISAEYFFGKDPAMEAIVGFPKTSDFGEVLKYLVERGAGLPSIFRLYYQHKTDPLWAEESTEHAMQRVAESFLSAKSYKEAQLIFQINFRDYPDSLTDALQAVKGAQLLNRGEVALDGLAKTLEGLKPPQ
jgi:hypothetical protein